ncbi:hypothetical protein KFE25_013405 [Diacronema lutheri]|uniref:AD domain-containing protein n=2 Tax=Diacronema lutheri TaxID=2081491 RepID=A0A8J6CB41_DIALT|nr:hypothetical protein KFE25_013405 [Diacronema lutheri]
MAESAIASLVGAHVELELLDGTRVSGLVYAVDPDTGHAIVCTPLEPQRTSADGVSVRPRVVFAHAIRRCTAAREPSWPACADLELVSHAAEPENAESGGPADANDAGERLRRLCALLERHRVPFDVYDHASAPAAAETTMPIVELFHALRIEPPYTARTCACENELVLFRVRTLLEQLD